MTDKTAAKRQAALRARMHRVEVLLDRDAYASMREMIEAGEVANVADAIRSAIKDKIRRWRRKTK